MAAREAEWTVDIDGQTYSVVSDGYRLSLNGTEILVEWKHSDNAHLAERIITTALNALKLHQTIIAQN